MTQKCPNCALLNPSSALVCDCGYSFTTSKVRPELRSLNHRGFWAKQFSLPSSRCQDGFDVIFGILAPIVCLSADPGFFRRPEAPILQMSMPGAPTYGAVSALVYMSIAIHCTTLAIWLSLKPCSAFIAGALGAGAMFAGLVGLLLMPWVAVGVIIFGIGLLGLTPFVTGLVFLRNSVRICLANGPAPSGAFIVLLLIGLVAVWGIPVSICVTASNMVDSDVHNVLDDSGSDRSIRRLRALRWFASLDRAVRVYDSETDEVRKRRLATAYQTVTGESIELRLSSLVQPWD